MNPAHRKLSGPLFSKLFSLAAALALCALPSFGQSPSFTSFDAPGAGTGKHQGTIAFAINLKGVIAGYYYDNSNLQHGFVRQPNGQFTDFTPPAMVDVYVYGINNSNVVLGTGSLNNGPYDFVGFLRNPNGHFTEFSPSGSHYTLPLSLNDSGEVTGYYQDEIDQYHGFLRDASGTITVIDDPDANIAGGLGTEAYAINAIGQIAGYYDDKNTGTLRSFIRDQFGNFTNFDPVPGGAVGVGQTYINLSGEIAGYYWGGDEIYTGFLRDASGNITDFAPAGSHLTAPYAINDSGVIVGFWENSVGVNFAFERDAAGNLTTFSAPKPNYSTSAYGINNNGQITGSWEDLNYVLHGFVQ
jgi:uncharacterized membrane protein